MYRFWTLALLAVVTALTTAAACSDDARSEFSSTDDDAGPPDAGGPVDGNGWPGCGVGLIACGDFCRDQNTDSDNCGACGHSCAGGTCSQGHCGPVVVANNVSHPLGVAVAGESVFWIRNGAIESCPVTGCTSNPTVLSDQVEVGPSQPIGTVIVANDQHVAWIATGNASGNGRDIFSCAVTGCTGDGGAPTRSTGLTGAPTQLAILGRTLLTTQSTGNVRRGPVETLEMAATELATAAPTGIAMNGTFVFVAGVDPSAPGVDRCALMEDGTCFTKTRLFAGATHVAADGTTVFATSDEGVKACNGMDGCNGSPTILYEGDKAAIAIASDGWFVAWVNPGATDTANGSVRMCKLPDCAGGVRTLAEGQAHPVGVTFSEKFVYWANSGAGGPGSIMRAALLKQR